MGKDKDTLQKEKINTEEDQGILYFRDERGEEAGKPFSSMYKNVSMNNMPRVSPLDALKSTVMRTASEIKKQETDSHPQKAEEKKPQPKAAENKKPFTADMLFTLEREPKKAEETKTQKAPETPVRKPKKESSLLAKCMPFIYDEEGISYAEEKPDYTLESVEDIITSAERRADERIARMYNLKANEIQNIREKQAEEKPQKAVLTNAETSIKKPVKIGDEITTAAKLFESAPVPEKSETLFDDLTARRTDMVGKESVISVYSAQGGMDSQEGASTRAIPELNPETDAQRYEDILSHTRPVNVEDISSSSTPKTENTAPMSFDDLEEEVEGDFKGAKDIKRVGNLLKGAAFLAKIRFYATAVLSFFAGILLIDGIKTEFAPQALTIIEFALLGLALLANGNIFSAAIESFKGKSKIELPLGIAMIISICYFIFGLIFGENPSGVALLPLASLLSYTYCSYKNAVCVFKNFKLMAARRPKTVLTLLTDPAVTTPMARSMSAGEVIIAGQKKTDEVLDFIKNTTAKKGLSGKAGIFTVVFLVVALFIGLAVGASGGGIVGGLFGAMVVLCLGAAPTLFIADMLPFVLASSQLIRYRAAVCSEASAERITDTGAVVVSSSDLFPRGTLKLYNMTPLSANELEGTLVLATAVSKHINSPVAHVFEKILTDDTTLPEADTVKYEEKLGISGWVGDDHILIGNRSLMIAHGVRVPELEIDKKILKQGHFPVYVAVNQRACALLTVGYSVDYDVMRKLGRLQDKGVVLLVDNCDPNITEQMLCDYFDFYKDLVRILDFSGVHKYKKATEPVKATPAFGFHRGDSESFIEIVLASFRLRLAKNVLNIIHLFAAILTVAAFAVLLLGSAELIGAPLCLLGELISLVISATAYFALK